jgi:Family of unknown function (DUF6893)
MGWVIGIIVAAIVALIGITTGPDIRRYLRIRKM